jgi:hypothetical protein
MPDIVKIEYHQIDESVQNTANGMKSKLHISSSNHIKRK